MSTNPIRVATGPLSKTIYAGRLTQDGRLFKEPRYDVTSDVLAAIKDKVGIGNEITVEADGVPEFRIAVLPVVRPAEYTAIDAWQELVEYDDRTSPAEYPDMALITFEELKQFMSAAHWDRELASTNATDDGAGHG